jgi:hypothetical protein
MTIHRYLCVVLSRDTIAATQSEDVRPELMTLANPHTQKDYFLKKS